MNDQTSQKGGVRFSIQLRREGINDEHLRPISEIKDEVYGVTINSSQFTDEGVTHFMNLTRLQVLDLENTAITDHGLGLLMKLPNLEVVIVRGTKVSEEGYRNAQSQLPSCEILWEDP